MTDRFQHAPDQVIPALVHFEFNPGLAVAGIQDGRPVGPRRPVSQFHPLAQAGEHRLARRPLDPGPVGLPHPEARVSEPVGQVTVIGEEQDSLGVTIQPPNGVDPLVHARQQL